MKKNLTKAEKEALANKLITAAEHGEIPANCAAYALCELSARPVRAVDSVVQQGKP